MPKKQMKVIPICELRMIQLMKLNDDENNLNQYYLYRLLTPLK